MALNVRRWILAALVGCGLIFVAYQPTGRLPEEGATPSFGPRLGVTPERRRADALGSALARAHAQLAAAERRDTLRLAARGRSSASPTLQIAFAASPAARRALEQAFAAVWNELAPLDTAAPVLVIVRNTYNIHTYVLPNGTDGRTCVASLSLGWQLRRLGRPQEEPPPHDVIVGFLRNTLGACAYYASFGPPGPAIEQWLEARSFDLAGQATWASPPPPPPAAEASAATLFDALVSGSDDRFRASFDALGCASGELGQCHQALFGVLATNPARYRPQMRGVVMDLDFFFEGRGFYGGRTYLADMVRDIGRERFMRFWRSALPPDSAFAEATGQPIEVWTARWQRARLHGMVLRNRVPLTSVLLSLLVAGVLIAGSSAAVTRRRVG